MKKRFYKKQVLNIDGWKQSEIERLRRRRRVLLLQLYAVIAAVAACSAVWIAVVYAHGDDIGMPSRMIVYPIMLLGIYFAVGCVRERNTIVKTIGLLSVDMDNYSAMMAFQLKKDYRNKEQELKKAKGLYKKYVNSVPNCKAELVSELKRSVKKPGEQIVTSMLCGLIFMCGDDRDLIFNARYRHGSAGNMVAEIWIRFLDGDVPPTITRESLVRDFCDFWNSDVTETIS